MRALALAAAVLVACAGGAALVLALSAGATTPKRVERIVVATASGDLVAIAPGGARERLTVAAAAETEPAVSFDGRRVAFVRDGAVHVLDLWTRKTQRVTVGTSPAWSPDGRVAYVTEAGVVVANDLIAPGAREPAWSSDGRLATVTDDGILVGSTLVAPGGRHPAWARDGRLAFLRDGALVVLDTETGEETAVGPGPNPEASHPTWSPDGTRIALDNGRNIEVHVLSGGLPTPLFGTQPGDTHPVWISLSPTAPPPEHTKPDPREILPDLDQRAPRGLRVAGAPGRWLLGFTSATDNIGAGPLWIRGSRSNTRTTAMRARQLIRLRNGRQRVVENVGLLRFVNDPPHYHWHFMRFQTFELRRASDGELLGRDRKTGFCFADHYATARHRVRNYTGPRFFGNCGQYRRDLRSVEMGTSVGFTDRYPAHFHGQNVDVTRVPPGVYVLVHRANWRGRIRESRYDNNAASLRLRLAWPGGRSSPPRVTILRRCEGRERC